MGVKTTAVSDIATHGGKVLEATTDWYAQDEQGNVWYFGEATKARNPDGTFDTSGSWLAGVHGARPGIMMTAHPAVGDAHRQEFWRGQAEDQYWLVELGAAVTVPAGSVHGRRTHDRVVAARARRDRREVLRAGRRRREGAGGERSEGGRGAGAVYAAWDGR